MSHISLNDLRFLHRELATLVQLGLPLAGGLQKIAAQSGHGPLAARLESAAQTLAEGRRLSDVWRERFPELPPLYVAILQAGEESGDLPRALSIVECALATQKAWRQQMSMVATYPLLLLGLACVFMLLSTFYWLPAFREVQEQMAFAPGIFLTWLLAHRGHGAVVALLLVGGLFLTSRYWQALCQREMGLNLPVVGFALRQLAYHRFCESVSAGLASRLPLHAALALAAPTTGHRVIAAAVSDLAEAARQGENIAAQARASGVFPELLCWRLALAQREGHLPETFAQLADHYREESKLASQRLTLLFGVLMITLGGAAVALAVGVTMMSYFELVRSVFEA